MDAPSQSCHIFPEKFRARAEDSGKYPAQLPGIFKNDRIVSWEFRKISGPAAEYFQK
jgi:hypothetical protein